MKKKVKGEKTKATVKVRIRPTEIVSVDRIEKVKAKTNIPNVYHPSYKLIDDTIEEIKKTSRKVCNSDYATNNVYLFLQDCLKRITLAEK